MQSIDGRSLADPYPSYGQNTLSPQKLATVHTRENRTVSQHLAQRGHLHKNQGGDPLNTHRQKTSVTNPMPATTFNQVQRAAMQGFASNYPFEERSAPVTGTSDRPFRPQERTQQFKPFVLTWNKRPKIPPELLIDNSPQKTTIPIKHSEKILPLRNPNQPPTDKAGESNAFSRENPLEQYKKPGKTADHSIFSGALVPFTSLNQVQRYTMKGFTSDHSFGERSAPVTDTSDRPFRPQERTQQFKPFVLTWNKRPKIPPELLIDNSPQKTTIPMGHSKKILPLQNPTPPTDEAGESDAISRENPPEQYKESGKTADHSIFSAALVPFTSRSFEALFDNKTIIRSINLHGIPYEIILPLEHTEPFMKRFLNS